jgi:2,4-dienoyl-CoA reductase (NADPH2)
MAAGGLDDRVTRCVGCAQGCFDKVMSLEPVTCMVNPRVGREGEPTPPAARRKRVVVVGGGPAGLMAAAVAAERGHAVTLYERDRLGGQLALAASSPGREDLWSVAEDLVRRAQAAGVELRVGRELGADELLGLGADAVVFATGARPLRLPLPGIDRPHVMHAWDVLSGRRIPGRRVVVLGGGLSNIEALYDGLTDLMARYVFSDTVDTRVVRASHGDSSGVRGAAWLWPGPRP